MILQRFFQEYKKSLSDPDLWLDCLSTWLLSVGAILAFDQLFRFHAELGEILLFPAFLVVLLAVLTRKGWLLPTLVLGIGCLYIALLSASGELEGRLEYLFGFLKWWMDLFPVRSVYNTAENIQLVMHIIQLLIVGIIFFCVRILRSVTAMGLMSLLMFAAIVAGGFRRNIGPMTCMAVGLFPLIARNFAAAQNRPMSRRNRPRIQRLTPSWSPRIAAVALCGAVGLLSMALLPGNTAHWTSAGMRQLATRIQRATNIGSLSSLNLFQPAELDRLGLMPNLSRLGGPLSSQSKATVLKLYADQPLLLRGTAYDTYTGSSWNTDWDEKKSGRYVYGDAANDAQKRLAFGLDLPLAETSLYSQVIRGMNVRVELYQNSTNLYTVGRTASIQTEVGGTDLYFNRRGEVFAQTNMRAPISYTVGARVFSRSTETERSELAYIASRAARDADPQYESVAGQYTQLPSKLPERVRQAAADATLGIVEPYKMAEALETYLSSNFRYTLTPSNVPSGRDFVEYFLETGEGYCVYFASAMAVMARSLGIPSRMVCGYGVKPGDTIVGSPPGPRHTPGSNATLKGSAGSNSIRRRDPVSSDRREAARFLPERVPPRKSPRLLPRMGPPRPGRRARRRGRAPPCRGHHDGIGRHDDGGGRPRFGGVGNADGTPRADLRHCRKVCFLLALAVAWRVLACAKRYRLDAVRQNGGGLENRRNTITRITCGSSICSVTIPWPTKP